MYELTRIPFLDNLFSQLHEIYSVDPQVLLFDSFVHSGLSRLVVENKKQGK